MICINCYFCDLQNQKTGSTKGSVSLPVFRLLIIHIRLISSLIEILRILHNSLSHHSFYNLLKSRDIGAGHIVALYAVSLSRIRCFRIDAYHDAMKLLIHFLK